MTKAMIRFDSEFDYLELRLHIIPDGVVMVKLNRIGDTPYISVMANKELPWMINTGGIFAGFTIVMELGE